MHQHQISVCNTHIFDSFVNWNMPFKLNILKHRGPIQGLSPAALTNASPSSVQVFTPADYKTPPANHFSPHDYVSPRSVAIQQRSAYDRADLILRGRFDEAINSMNNDEKV
jgi:hypothetical protein